VYCGGKRGLGERKTRGGSHQGSGEGGPGIPFETKGGGRGPPCHPKKKKEGKKIFLPSKRQKGGMTGLHPSMGKEGRRKKKEKTRTFKRKEGKEKKKYNIVVNSKVGMQT